MLLKPCDLGCLAHASYLGADEAPGIAAIVDPPRGIDQYLQDASPLGLDIRSTCFLSPLCIPIFSPAIWICVNALATLFAWELAAWEEEMGVALAVPEMT
jgi:hypothetical protein